MVVSVRTKRFSAYSAQIAERQLGRIPNNILLDPSRPPLEMTPTVLVLSREHILNKRLQSGAMCRQDTLTKLTSFIAATTRVLAPERRRCSRGPNEHPQKDTSVVFLRTVRITIEHNRCSLVFKDRTSHDQSSQGDSIVMVLRRVVKFIHSSKIIVPPLLPLDGSNTPIRQCPRRICRFRSIRTWHPPFRLSMSREGLGQSTGPILYPTRFMRRRHLSRVRMGMPCQRLRGQFRVRPKPLKYPTAATP